MERKFVIDGEEHVVSTPSQSEGSIRGELFAWITVDGVKHSVEVIHSGPHHLDLVVDGERRMLHIARDEQGTKTWVSAGGRARLLTEAPQEKRSRRGMDRAGGRQRKVAPSFPATVVRVLVEVGEVVTQGQALVVVSAMKMEMTLTAPHAGVVRSINAAKGASVGPEDELVVVDAARDDEEGEERADG
jgi:biotin carboxyl carrier protein